MIFIPCNTSIFLKLEILESLIVKYQKEHT